MFTADESQVSQVAAQNNVPPAILAALAQQSPSDQPMRLSDASLQGQGLTRGQLVGDQAMQLEVAARVLSSLYSQYGSWERALSAYVSGNPDAYQSATSSVGGFVFGTLGMAATDASWGMAAYTPSDPAAFTHMASGFASTLHEMSDTGGVVTRQAASAFQTAAGAAANRAITPTAGGNVGATSQDGFFEAVLQRMNIPSTPTNLAVMRLMAQGEGMDPSTFNPLATTQGGPGARSINSVGVKAFPSFEAGVEATATVFQNGLYDGILQGMRTGQPLAYFAQGQAAQNLQTWQGGSTLDVRLIAGAAQSGQAPAAAQGAAPAQQQVPTPKEVADFAGQLQASNIDPEAFIAHYPDLARLRSYLLQTKTSVDDFAKVVGMSPAEMLDHVRTTPHPRYPNLTAGQYVDIYNQATLHSVPKAGRTPYPAEVSRIASAGLKWDQIGQFYDNLMQSVSSTVKSTAATAAQPLTPDKMPRQPTAD